MWVKYIFRSEIFLHECEFFTLIIWFNHQHSISRFRKSIALFIQLFVDFLIVVQNISLIYYLNLNNCLVFYNIQVVFICEFQLLVNFISAAI